MNLVFEQPKEEQNWTNTMLGLIKRNLEGFISGKTLSEFLAAIDAPELEKQVEDESRIQMEANELSGVERETQANSYDQPIFSPRTNLTDLFYDFTSIFNRTVKLIGVEIRWIGVGTWVTPDEIIPERHLKAWTITRDNVVRGGQKALEKLENQNRRGAMVGLIQETINDAMQQIDDKVGEEDLAMKQIVAAYRKKLRTALDLYEQNDEAQTPEARRLRQVLEHLARVTYRWLGDAGG